MGRGKKLNKNINYPKVDISGNILDKSSIKSFYLLISGYFDLDEDNINLLQKKISKTIKQNLNKDIFYIDRVIDIGDIRLFEKYNYGGFEYTIFLKRENLITFEELNYQVKNLTDIIYDKHFHKPEFEIK